MSFHHQHRAIFVLLTMIFSACGGTREERCNGIKPGTPASRFAMKQTLNNPQSCDPILVNNVRDHQIKGYRCCLYSNCGETFDCGMDCSDPGLKDLAYMQLTDLYYTAPFAKAPDNDSGWCYVWVGAGKILETQWIMD